MESIVISATGTGGHIFPALSIAEKLNDLGYQIEWFGSHRGMEAEILANKPYRSHTFAFYGVRKKGLLTWLKMPWQLLKATKEVRKTLDTLIHANRVKHVVVMGGYIAVPVALAAKSLGISLIMHEQNTVPGLANRFISLFADEIYEGFAGSFKNTWMARLYQKKIHVTGNPLRQRILELASKEIKQFKKIDQKETLKLLVMGGSLGAEKLNQIAPKSISEWQKKIPTTLNVVHQCGKNRRQALEKDYKELNLQATVMEFIDDMAEVYQQTDLIIARSGASTVTEIYALGIPAILIPYPYAVDNHQYFNALWLKQRQACTIIEEQRLSPQALFEALEYLQKNATQQKTKPNNAVDEIVKLLA